jgi:four helix bundle protein
VGQVWADAALRGGKEANMENATICSAPKPKVGIEGLDAYRVAVDFYRLLRQSTRGRRGHVIDQSYRAAESVILNIAEAYPMPGADRARRFRIAGAEAAECHAGLDLLEIRGELKGPALSELRTLLDRTRAMLWRLGRP